MSDTSTRDDRIAAGCLQILGIGFFVLIFLVSAWPDSDDDGRARASDVAWERYDVTIDVGEDGSLHITEYQEVEFDGRFSTGFVEIPMERIESIDNVTVTLEEGVTGDGQTVPFRLDEEPEGDLVPAKQVAWDTYTEETNSFRARQEDGLFLIDYAFEPTSYGWSAEDTVNNTRTIVVEYDAHGVIRDYPEVEEPWQQFHWMAISPDVTSLAPVRSASVTVHLPEAVATDDLVVAPVAVSNDGRTITWERRSMAEGSAFDVQAAFPTITEATSPAWQDAADARDASLEEREQRRSAGQLMLIMAGISILVVGGLTLLYAWYRGIREPNIGPVHHEVTNPPGDLPGVLVGSLLDEEVHPRDIAAGVLDLDKQGIITIRNGTEGEPERYYLTLNDFIPLRPAWARAMLRAIFGDDARAGTTKGFSALKDLFGTHRHALQHAIDQTLVDDGYYEELPETSRKHWTWVTNGFAVAGVVASLAILFWVQSWTWWSIVPLIPGFALWWFGRKLTPHVAQKTHKGAEAASLWRAFERHLISTNGWATRETRAQRETAYGPWMTAFGLQQGWLSEMNRPTWEASSATLSPFSRPVRGDAGTSSRTSSSPTRRAGGGTSVEPPAWRPTGVGWDAGRWGDMQSASNSVGSTLSSMSESAFTMIGDMLEAIGSSSGGSGSSGGGSSFRGSSSRSGGGRSRSSSGGGRRGFR